VCFFQRDHAGGRPAAGTVKFCVLGWHQLAAVAKKRRIDRADLKRGKYATNGRLISTGA